MTAVLEPLKVADPFGYARKKQGDKKAHEKSAYTVAQWDNILKNSAMNLRIMDHGGGCCGAKHLANFPAYDIMWELELVKRLAKFRGDKPGQTIEVILINGQFGPDFIWVKLLLKLGFKFVAHNRNSNSQNENFVFLFTTAPLDPAFSPNLQQILKLQEEMNVQEPSASN